MDPLIRHLDADARDLDFVRGFFLGVASSATATLIAAVTAGYWIFFY